MPPSWTVFIASITRHKVLPSRSQPRNVPVDRHYLGYWIPAKATWKIPGGFGETGWLLADRDHGHETAPAFRAHLMWQTVYVSHQSPYTPRRQMKRLDCVCSMSVPGSYDCGMHTPHLWHYSHLKDSFTSSPPTWPPLMLALVLAFWGLHTKRAAHRQDTALTHQGPTYLPPLLPHQRTPHGSHQAWLDQRDLRVLVFWL